MSETLDVKDLKPDMVQAALIQGVKSKRFCFNLELTEPQSLIELLEMANKYIISYENAQEIAEQGYPK